MGGASECWISNTDVTATTFTELSSDPRNVMSYDKLVITVRCVTAPPSGNVQVKIQHSYDYASVGTDGTPHWEDLILFDSFDTNGTVGTDSVVNFHSFIRAVALNSEASQSSAISVFIRGQ